MANFEGKRLAEIGRGDTGVIYCEVLTDNPDPKTIIKHPVSKKEKQLAGLWADRNCNEEDNYSAGPVKEVEFEIRPGKTVTGLQMAYLGDTTYQDCSEKLSVGENILLYLMLVHCTLRLAGLMLFDTAYNNCMCQGKEEDFRIFLVDTEAWETSEMESYIIDNFNLICREFQLGFNLALDKIKPFLEEKFTCERAFLSAVVKSCEDLSEHFLYSNNESEDEELEDLAEDERFEDTSVHYHERIDHLLDAIKREKGKALMRLQAFEALDAASVGDL